MEEIEVAPFFIVTTVTMAMMIVAIVGLVWGAGAGEGRGCL